MLLEQGAELDAEILSFAFVEMGGVLEAGLGVLELRAHPLQRGRPLEIEGHVGAHVREHRIKRIRRVELERRRGERRRRSRERRGFFNQPQAGGAVVRQAAAST